MWPMRKARAAVGGDAPADGLVQALLDHHDGRGRGRLRQRRLEDRHLLHGDPVGLDDRREHDPGQRLAAGVVVVGPLDQGADDVLLRLDAAEEVPLGLRVGLVVEDRRVARVHHEAGDLRPHHHPPRAGSGRVETHEEGAVLHPWRERLRDRLDPVVGHREDDDVRLRAAPLRRRPASPRAPPAVLPARLRDLHVEHPVRRLCFFMLSVIRQPILPPAPTSATVVMAASSRACADVISGPRERSTRSVRLPGKRGSGVVPMA